MYNLELQQNDIALLKLATPVTLNNHIQVACLPTDASSFSSYPLPNTRAIAVGWGLHEVSTAGGSSDALQNVGLNIYEPTKYCSSYKDTNWSTQMCCGDLDGTKEACESKHSSYMK